MTSKGAESVLVVQNPVCSRADKAREVVGWLLDSRWAGNLEVLQTIPPSEGSNTQLIRNALEPGSTVLSLGGDGLAHDVFNAIKQADEAGEVGADEVAMVPVPTGNANDLSLSLYHGNILRGGEHWPWNLTQRNDAHLLWDLLKHGERNWLDGMKLEAGDHLDMFVHGYIGLGFTAQAAAAINEPEFRRRRSGVDVLTGRALDTSQVLKVLLSRQPFVYENGSDPRKAQELLYAVIPRIAAGVINLDTHALDGEILQLEVADKGFLPKALVKIGAGLFGGAKGKFVSDEAHEIKLHTPTAIQYDGEPDELPAGTVVHISHQREIVQALA